MNAILDAWNNADEATAYDAMIACCGAMRWAKGMVALRPIEHCRRVERSSRPHLEHNGGARLAGSLRLPSAHRRTQISTRGSKIGRMVETGAIVGGKRLQKTYWRKLPPATRTTRSSSASPILCAPQEKAQRKCSQFSGAASSETAATSCLRPRNSNARSRRFVWESGL